MKIFDAHISGSLSVSSSAEISNNLLVSGNLTVLGNISGSVSGNITSADTASFAPKYTLTSSFQTFTSSYTTGSFTGSFIGSGTGLYGIPASGITGLNLSQIAEGSSTASISSTNGLRVNTNTEITGALTATGQISGSFKGDGTNLYNIPASGVTGLNLTRIADGVATASISNANGLRVNSNTEITGAFNLNNMTLGVDKTISSTVTDFNGKYYINGVSNPRLSFIKGFKYRFYNSNNNTHPILFSTTNDGTHNAGSTYTIGVTEGTSPYYIEIEITKDTPTTLYYYCDHHTNMGNSISITNDVLNNIASNNIVFIDPSRLATTGSNAFTGSQNISGSVNLTGSLNITGSISLNGVPVGTGKLDETTFNTYTSSNDSTNSTQNSRLTSIESTTSSLNTFSSSIDTTIKNKLNTETVISGSVQVLITGTTGYSTFSSSISTSIGSLSSSVATTTSGLSSSIGSLSSSIDSLSSSVATTTSGLSSSVATTTSGLSSSIATTTLGLSSSIVSLSSSVATTTSGLSSSIVSLSSSVATTTLNTKNRVDSIETSTGSLNSFTSSINTTIKSKLDSESVISGSVQVVITGTTGYSAFSSSVATTTSGLSSSIGSLSSSVATTTSGLSSSVAITTSGLTSTITSLSSSVATTTSGLSSSIATTTLGLSSSIVSLSSSVATTTSGLSSSVATTTSGLSSSVATTTSGLSSSIGSLSSSVATTTSGLSSSIVSLSSSVATTTLGTKNRVDSIEAKTGSYATTGSNIFQGNQTITGSLYVSQDLIIAGSSSIQHISSSIVNIADNIITVNASNPSLKFGGLAVIDSGSSPQVSGSILFDSVENQWIFIHQNQATVTSSMLIMGPETYDNIGNETHLTLNRLVKSVNDEHIGDSNITDTGTKVSINSNTEVTGTLKVTGVITNPNITAIESATGSLNTFTSSLLTAIELTGSNLTVRGNFLVKGTTTNVNTTTLDVDNNLINLNGSGASFAGLRVKDTTAPNQISGSLLWDAANDYWIAGQLGSEQRLVRETEFNNAVTRIGNVETSTGSLNSFTSSINTTIKTKLNTEGVLSSSIQVNHNATTNYVANQHIDHTTVSITAGSGLTGGGDISTTRTINVGAGNGITVNADDIAIDTSSATFTTGVKTKMNTDTVMSGSYLGTATTANLSENASYLYYTDARVKTKLNAEGVVSGSSQISLASTTGFGSYLNQAVLTTSTPTFSTVSATTFTGALSGNATTSTSVSATIAAGSDANLLYANVATDDYVRIRSGGAYNGGYLEIATADDGTEPIYVRQYTGVFSSVTRTATLLDGSGNTIFPGTISASNYSGTSSGTNTGDQTSVSGNAGTVTNGVYTTGTYSDPAWITAINYSKLTGTIPTWNQNTSGNASTATNLSNSGTVTLATATESNSIYITQPSYTTDTPVKLLNFAWYSDIWSLGNIRSGGATSSGLGIYLTSVEKFRFTSTSFLINGYTTLHSNNYSTYASPLAGSSSITTVGTISSGTWNGTTIAVANGGTGGTTAAAARTNLGLAIGSDVLAYRTFGTAANSATGDFAPAAGSTSVTTLGTISTGTWNGTSIATTYTAAKVTAVNAGTGVGVDTTTGSVTVSIGQAVATSSSPTFARVTTPKIAFERNANAAHGLSWYNISTYTAWCDYMANGGATSTGPSGNITASTGTYVTSWARRFFVEDASTYGWIFEKGGTTSTTPSVVAELRSSDGLFSTAGAIYSAGSLVKTSANSSYSTTFSSVSSVTVTHSLGTKDVAVFVYDSSDNMFWPSSIVTTSTSVVTITFASSRSGRVVVVR